MQTILIGESETSDKLINTIGRLLGRCGGLLAVAQDSISLSGERPDYVITTAGRGAHIDLPSAIYLLPKDADFPKLGPAVKLIADSTRETWPKHFEQEFISCGRSAKDTMTLSSHTDDSAVVALVRTIKTLSGQVIEPCEYPVLYSGKDPFIAFAAVGVLLLLDRTDVLGEMGRAGKHLQL